MEAVLTFLAFASIVLYLCSRIMSRPLKAAFFVGFRAETVRIAMKNPSIGIFIFRIRVENPSIPVADGGDPVFFRPAGIGRDVKYVNAMNGCDLKLLAFICIIGVVDWLLGVGE